MPKRSIEDKLNKYKAKIRKIEKKKHEKGRKSAANSHATDTGVEDIMAENSIEECITPLTPPPTPSLEPQFEVEVPQIDPQLLSALGDDTNEGSKFGPNIHPTLAERWDPILKKGLPKEIKEKLMKEYLVPENCTLLQAPRLNLEISAAITEMSRNRDKKLETSQQLLGVGISAINKAITVLLTQEDKVQAVKALSDGCRILTDLHFRDTQARTKLILPGLSKPFLSVIQDCERDDTLFGNKLPEQIKASKAIEKQGNEIKKAAQTVQASHKRAQPSTSTQRTPYQGNYLGPPRYPSNRGGRGGQRKPVMYTRKPPHPTATRTSKAQSATQP